MEAEVLSDYKCIKVIPLAIADAGEVVSFEELLTIFLTEFDATMLAASSEATVVTYAERVKVTKNTGETWTAGEFVYWDSGNSWFTNVEGTGTILAGQIAEDALSAAVIGYIMFNGELANIRGNGQLVAGSSTVTGNITDVATGLTVIQYAVATAKGTAQAANDAGYCTVDFGADGLLDIYCWDDEGGAASNAATVYWMAWGLK
ncbi:MAG: DUF2190 family protein [Candidatus Lokiarchaeota archaeon]